VREQEIGNEELRIENGGLKSGKILNGAFSPLEMMPRWNF
jgi:hypothetical protein